MLVTRIWKSQPGKYFCISTKSATGRWEDHFFKRSEFKEVEEFLKDNRDKDCYFCPHGFTKDRRLKPYAVLPSILWADLDEIDPREAKPKPSIAIESSPGRFVGFWMIDKEMTESANRRLAYMLGADRSGWDLTQVLRVPGTNNYKYATQPRVRLMWSDGPSYRLKDIERMLPGEKEVPDAGEESDVAAVFKKWKKKMPYWCRRELMHGKPTQGKRSEMIWKLGNTLLECGVSDDDAFVLLKASPWNKFRGRRNEDDQLRRELDKSINKHFPGGRSDHSDDEEDAKDDYKWVSQPLSDVEEEDIDWIWFPYLARGEVSILEGDPGLGKSYLAQVASGHIIDGKKLPSVQPLPPVEGKVVYFDIENSAATVTKKRMVGNEFKNLQYYYQEEGIFSIDDEDTMERIFEALERIKPVLVVFDTLNTYIGKADAFKGHEAQQAFNHFRELARRFHCAVLVLRHLTKSSAKGPALYRGQGSMAFAGVARVVITMGVLPTDPNTKAIATSKFNMGERPSALTFNVRSVPDTKHHKGRSKFTFGEFVELTADEILVQPNKDAQNSVKDAKEFLKELLTEEDVDQSRLFKMAETRSIPHAALERAGSELGVKKKSKGFGKKREVTWSLPDD